MVGERLDRELVKRGLVSTRSKAKFYIEAGGVFCNGEVKTSVSYTVYQGDILKLDKTSNPWVSRAGLKLDFAIKKFNILPLNGIALDIGASTGGFTDVLLFHGCKKVYAVDVGSNQLDKKLKEDKRVINFEGVNAKNIDDLGIPLLDNIVCDVSFISAIKVLKSCLAYSKSECKLIVLVKPQFEVGREAVGKNGIVKNAKDREKACEAIVGFLQKLGWLVEGLVESPIMGAQGNIEYLVFARKRDLCKVNLMEF